MIVFDFDNCLFSTENLIRRAYADAGVQVDPGFMAAPPAARMLGSQVRAAKDAAYLRRLARDPLTPLAPWHAARQLSQRGEVVALLSSAPAGTIAVLSQRVAAWPFRYARAGLTAEDKTVWLQRAGHGVYVDDQEYVIMPPGWRLVRFNGQSTHQLVDQIGGS